MNPKDTGFFKQNIEKLILAAALLFMLVFAWWFLVGDPFTPKIGNRAVTPDEIENQFTTRIDRLDRALKDTESKLPVRDIPPYSKAFEATLAQTPTTLAALTPMSHPGLDPSLAGDDGPPTEYNLPRPPIAQDILIRKGHSVLSNRLPARELPGFIKLIGDGETRDFNYVSVAATFDMDEWVLRLQSGEKDKRIPQRWWNGMLGVASVTLQRQELDEATGEWGNTVMVDPLPNQLAYAAGFQTQDNPKAAKEITKRVRVNQELIARSEFPQTSGNILWSPPNEDAQELDADGQRKLSRLNATIKRLQEQILTIEQQMQQGREATGQERGRQEKRRAPRGGRGGADRGGAGATGGFDGGGGGRTSSRSRTSARGGGNRQAETPQTPQERARLFNEQLIEAKLERNTLLGIESDVLSNQGYSSTPPSDNVYGGGYGGGGGYPGGSGGFGAPGGPGAYGPTGGYPGEAPYGGAPGVGQPQEPESRKIKVWAHDLSIKPGKTYRYRVVVSVLNPLHRRPRIADAQRAENFHKLSLGPDPQELQASPWSEPVQVDFKSYFFMVKGSVASARVEVWRVYDGKWIDQEFDVRPGDPIGHVTQKQLQSGIQQSLDMNVGMIVVDLVRAAGGSFGGGGVRMLYLDPENNRIADRTIQGDRSHPDRIRLQNEQALESELALTNLTSTSASP
jgi:hypothetical protein